MDHKRVSKDLIRLDENSHMARGSYGEVRRGRLDGYDPPVAVKELRPLGTKDHRLRVEIVSHS